MRLGLREANQHFSRTIKAIRAGKEVVLTDRGRAIAVIRPLAKAAGADDEATALRTLQNEGLIIPASRKGPMPTPRWRPVAVKGKSVSQTILDDREDRA